MWRAYHSRLGIVLATDDIMELTKALHQARTEARRHGIREFDSLSFRKSPDNTQLWMVKTNAQNPAKSTKGVDPPLSGGQGST
jgi:hypothetical protein